MGEDDRAVGRQRLAEKIHAKFEKKNGFNEKTKERLGIPTMLEMKKEVLRRLLDPQRGLPPELAAVLATKTGQKWPPEKTVEPAIIPPPPASTTTNTNALPAGNKAEP